LVKIEDRFVLEVIIHKGLRRSQVACPEHFGVAQHGLCRRMDFEEVK